MQQGNGMGGAPCMPPGDMHGARYGLEQKKMRQPLHCVVSKRYIKCLFYIYFFLKIDLITEDKRKTMLMLISADVEIFILP